MLSRSSLSMTSSADTAKDRLLEMFFSVPRDGEGPAPVDERRALGDVASPPPLRDGAGLRGVASCSPRARSGGPKLHPLRPSAASVSLTAIDSFRKRPPSAPMALPLSWRLTRLWLPRRPSAMWKHALAPMRVWERSSSLSVALPRSSSQMLDPTSSPRPFHARPRLATTEEPLSSRPLSSSFAPRAERRFHPRSSTSMDPEFDRTSAMLTAPTSEMPLPRSLSTRSTVLVMLPSPVMASASSRTPASRIRHSERSRVLRRTKLPRSAALLSSNSGIIARAPLSPMAFLARVREVIASLSSRALQMSSAPLASRPLFSRTRVLAMLFTSRAAASARTPPVPRSSPTNPRSTSMSSPSLSCDRRCENPTVPSSSQARR
mmetsp:Transcript_72395/g.228212  ORF Transcript_72395/g.228212 Transcript_72395/m.228212 type:complete len:377 (-) Transcript_72395:172-1302(-)